jgi:hypothetical protein
MVRPNLSVVRRLALVAVVLLLAGVACRREPGAGSGTPGTASTSPAVPSPPSPTAADPTAVPPAADVAAPANPGAVEVLEPPMPSGWTSGTDFHPPPAIVVTNVPDVSGFNMLQNPGFEDGTEPWWYFPDRPHWGGFTVTTAQALSGRWSARLDLLCDEQHPPPSKAHIRGVIQNVQTPVFPARVSGDYYVETWEKGTVDQYIQFVVIVAGVPMTGGAVSNTQIRYLLAGIDHPPFDIANAKFFYVTKEEPQVGKWVHFERDLVQDFTELWGSIPAQFEHVRVLFEVRWDNVDLANPPRLHSVVYFDDLYLGT